MKGSPIDKTLLERRQVLYALGGGILLSTLHGILLRSPASACKAINQAGFPHGLYLTELQLSKREYPVGERVGMRVTVHNPFGHGQSDKMNWDVQKNGRSMLGGPMMDKKIFVGAKATKTFNFPGPRVRVLGDQVLICNTSPTVSSLQGDFVGIP